MNHDDGWNMRHWSSSEESPPQSATQYPNEERNRRIGEHHKQRVTVVANHVIQIIKHWIERMNRMRVHSASCIWAGCAAGSFAVVPVAVAAVSGAGSGIMFGAGAGG